jgi:hypothetical protein
MGKIFTISFFLFSIIIHSQSTPEWIIYNTSNSELPSNYINHIAIDDLNRKWISVPDYGLLKIENDNWTVYNTSNSDIPSNTLSTIGVDSDNNIWAGGVVSFILAKFDGTSWNVWDNSNASVPGVIRTALEFDNQNHVWFLSRNDGTIYSTYYIVEFSEDSIWTTHSSIYTSNGFRQLLFDNNQTLWIGDPEGLYYYDGTNLNYIPYTPPLGQYVTDVKLDSTGNIWFALGYAGWGALEMYDGTSFTGFSPVAIAIDIDTTGNIWVGTLDLTFSTGAELKKFDGNTWTTYNSLNSPLPKTFMITDLAFDTFGNLWIATFDSGLVVFNENGIVTPVELFSFNADVIINSKVKLDWRTATEMNNKGFEIERLQDSKIERLKDLPTGQAGWLKIGFVNGHGTTTEPNSYSFIDESIQSGKYQYRLKQIDFDGSFEYSDIVEVDIAPSTYSLSQNYPNPFNPSTTIKYSISNAGIVTLKEFDVLGKEVATLVNEEKPAGNYEVEFDGRELTSGVYFYQLKSGEFIQTKKMLLLK